MAANNNNSLPQTETHPVSSSSNQSNLLSLEDSPSSKTVYSTLEWYVTDAMGPFMALASSASYAMTTTCARDARLRASTSTTTWSLSPTPSPTVHGDSRTPGHMALEGDILVMVGGAREGAIIPTDSVTTVVIITDSDLIIPHMALGLAQAVLLLVPVLGVDSVEEAAAVQGEGSVAVGVVGEAVEVVLHGGGEVQLRGRLDSSSNSRLVVEQLNQWRQLPTLNSNNSHPARRREGASFMELDKPCPVSWSHLV